MQSVQTLGQRIQSLIGAVGSKGKNSVDLNLIASTTYYSCMGLPQDLINYIMEMLHNDFEALKMCLLTCKVLFASTQHLIHKTLRMTLPNIRSVLTQEERKRIRDNYEESYGVAPDLNLLPCCTAFSDTGSWPWCNG